MRIHKNTCLSDHSIYGMLTFYSHYFKLTVNDYSIGCQEHCGKVEIERSRGFKSKQWNKVTERDINSDRERKSNNEKRGVFASFVCICCCVCARGIQFSAMYSLFQSVIYTNPQDKFSGRTLDVKGVSMGWLGLVGSIK